MNTGIPCSICMDKSSANVESPKWVSMTFECKNCGHQQTKLVRYNPATDEVEEKSEGDAMGV